MARFIIIGAIVLLGAIVSFFTVSGKDVSKFNDALVDSAQSVDQTFVPLGAIMDQYAEKKQVDVSVLNSAIANAGTAIDTKISGIEAMQVPDDDLCREFHASVRAYATHSRLFLGVYRDRFLPYVEAHNPGTDDDVAATQAMFTVAVKEDERLFEVVKACQVNMAKKYKMKLR